MGFILWTRNLIETLLENCLKIPKSLQFWLISSLALLFDNILVYFAYYR